MNEKDKQEYLEEYKQEKKKGVPFFPDILFKDAVASLVVFLALVALAYFIGAPLEPRANPADTSYTPRPEWYFMFLFQLLKYFPGNLEVVGVVVIPTLAIILLFILPLLDRSPQRHFRNRLPIMGVTLFAVVGVVALSIQSVREAPPPAEATEGDQTAALYAKNCAGCHGPTIKVAAGTNLHAVITQGKHEGMPPWSADLTSDQIDALAGFILSPGGSQLFTDNCGDCHEAAELVAGDPLELKNALEQGKNYPAHLEAEVPDWTAVLSQEERTALLNFLVAPDGQRLFATDCSPCHGQSVAFTGEEADLRTIISEGGLHLQMPQWQEKFSPTELDTLTQYVLDPSPESAGHTIFQENCTSCHGERIPAGDDFSQTRETIASGGSHQTMPVWGEVLTPEQLDALVSYTLDASKGTSIEVGQQLYITNCAPCHGDFGEGGPNPARAGDIIAPISTAEYLKTRDDFTLRAIISQGQPNTGMSPFASNFGGHLEDDEIDAIVAYLRAWEANPPVEFPPEIAVEQISLSGTEIYQDLCAQCHGTRGEGGIGPQLSSPQYQEANTDQDIFDTIDKGHAATAMIAWGEILSSDQIQQLVEFIRQMEPVEADGPAEPSSPTSAAGKLSFSADVLPIFEAKCVICHGNLGGWDAASYNSVMTTGNNAPVVIPGNPEGSLLGQKLLGTHTKGAIMPPGGKLPEDEIQVILDWIAAGAEE
jgi:mono/diheme cytochrome c family protein